MPVSYRPNLNSRVHVIVDVIIFQHSMAIVIEVDPDLWKQTHTRHESNSFIPACRLITLERHRIFLSPHRLREVLPASRCVSCSSSGLVCCPLSPTLLPACCYTPRSPLWRLVLFRAAEHKAAVPHRSLSVSYIIGKYHHDLGSKLYKYISPWSDSPHIFHHVGHRGSCCVWQWDNCLSWFEFLPGHCRRCHFLRWGLCRRQIYKHHPGCR